MMFFMLFFFINSEVFCFQPWVYHVGTCWFKGKYIPNNMKFPLCSCPEQIYRCCSVFTTFSAFKLSHSSSVRWTDGYMDWCDGERLICCANQKQLRPQRSAFSWKTVGPSGRSGRGVMKLICAGKTAGPLGSTWKRSLWYVQDTGGAGSGGNPGTLYLSDLTLRPLLPEGGGLWFLGDRQGIFLMAEHLSVSLTVFFSVTNLNLVAFSCEQTRSESYSPKTKTCRRNSGINLLPPPNS